MPCPGKMTRYAAKFMQYAFVAGCEAIAQERLDLEKEPYRTGICAWARPWAALRK